MLGCDIVSAVTSDFTVLLFMEKRECDELTYIGLLSK